MFKKAGIVKGTDGKPSSAPLKVEDLIASIERYYSPDQQLVAKQGNDEAFKAYLEANPQLVPSKHNAHAQPGEGAEGDQPEAASHVVDEVKVTEETAAAREKWLKQVLCEHLVYLRGVEVTYFEFKEIMLDVTINHLRYQLDPKSTGKVKPMLTRFLDEHFPGIAARVVFLGVFLRRLVHAWQERPAFQIHQVGGHHDELGREVDVEQLEGVDVVEILAGDALDGNGMDVHLVLFDEVE